MCVITSGNVPRPNVPSVLHDNVTRGLAALDHRSKLKEVCVQTNLHALTATLHHQQGSHSTQTLQLQLLCEMRHALFRREEKLGYTAAPSCFQCQLPLWTH